MDERVSIRDNTKPLRKYGSISSNNTNFIRNEYHCIKHVVTQTDTLQGLALKYSVTVIILFVLHFFFYHLFIPMRYNACGVVFLRPVARHIHKTWSVSKSYFLFPIHPVVCNMPITRISILNLNPLERDTRHLYSLTLSKVFFPCANLN